MKYNLNSLSGIFAIYFLAGATASFPASFIFKGNGDLISGSIFTIIGASFLAIGAVFMFLNSKSSDEGLSEIKRSQTMRIILLLAVLTASVMTILGETVRF